MGAWGAGSFDNDDAMDWLVDLAESPDESVLLAAFRAVPAHLDVYIDLPEAANALAAAEVVAAAVGSPRADLPPEVTGWLEAHGSTVGHSAVGLALEATRRVVASSELSGLWEESDSNAEWLAAVASLQERLLLANA